MATWTLDLRDRTGGALLKAGVAFRSLSARWVLNGPGSIEVELRHDEDVGTATAGTAELQLLRDGVIVWAGPWLSSDVDPRARSLRLTGEGLWWWFRNRLVDADLLYTDTAQHTIARNLIAHTQAQSFGSLGIVAGTHTGATKTRTRFYCASERPNIAEEVEAFTQYETGFDFAIAPATRAFDTFTPARRSVSGIALSGSSVDSLRWSEDVRDVRTFISAIGDDDCGVIVANASDTGLATTYGRIHEAVDADDNDDTKGELTEVANEALAARKRVRFDASLAFREGGTGAPAFSLLVPGDTLTLTDTRGYSTFTAKVLRMVEVGVHLDNGLPNVPVFTLECSREIG